jgi:hypothetical protein
MKNKVLFEEWLSSFKRNINGKKFNAVKSYMNYMGVIEKHLDIEKDAIYDLSDLKKLKKLEAKLRLRPTFVALSENYQASLLSALHVYQNLMEILSKNSTKKISDGSKKNK